MSDATSKIPPASQQRGESLTIWADRVVKVCRKTETNISTGLDRLDSWLFLEGLRDEQLRQHLREMPYIGLSVTLGKAIDLTMEKDHDDSDKQSTTTIVHPTPNRPQDVGSCDDLGATQQIDEGVSSTDLCRMLELLLKEQLQLRGDMHRLLRVQQNLIVQQQSSAKKQCAAASAIKSAIMVEVAPKLHSEVETRTKELENHAFSYSQKLSIMQHKIDSLKFVVRCWLKMYSFNCRFFFVKFVLVIALTFIQNDRILFILSVFRRIFSGKDRKQSKLKLFFFEN